MPIRSATSPFHNLARAALLALAIAWPAPPAPAQPAGADAVELSLDQARVLAIEALRGGDPGLALRVAAGLLQADPKDPLAHYVIASAYARMNRPRAGRQAAARAYRYGAPGRPRFAAAQLAARLAYAENRPTLAQIWLRRTAIHAASETDKEGIARDYGILRRQNPWALRLRTDLRPSSNVNNGADTALQIIDGVPVTGLLSGAAQALSGVIATVDAAATYRLRASETSATSLGGRLYVQRVALSDSARAQAPSAENSDFASSFAEMSLRHGFVAGPPGQSGTAAVDLAYGDSWWAGERSYSFARIGAERGWRPDERTRLVLRGLAETRFRARYGVNDANITGLSAELSRALKTGDLLGLSLALRDTRAESVNGTFRSASLRASYAPDRTIGAVRLSAGLVLGYSDYPVFRSGIIWVPGGRQDKSIYGDLNLFFDRLDYAGFAPTLRLRAGRKRSNDSRFSTREFSVSLGVESKF